MLYRDEINCEDNDRQILDIYIEYLAAELSETLTPIQRLKLREVLNSSRSENFIGVLREVLEKDLQETMLPDD